MSGAADSRVAIAGAGGMGREALAWLRDARPDLAPVAFFTADPSEKPVGMDVDLPTLTTVEQLHEAGAHGVVLGIGDNTRRRKVAVQVEGSGLKLVTVRHPTAFLGPGVRIGAGSIIAPGCVLTRDVRIGRGVVVNYGAKIGHDCVLGDFVFVGPGAVLAGDIHVATGVVLGAGAVLLQGREVGMHATVGAGAVVVRSVADEATVVGSPAKPMPKRWDCPDDGR